MTKEQRQPIVLKSLDLAGILRLFQEVLRSGQPRTIISDDEEAVVVMPATLAKRRGRKGAISRSLPVTEDDPLFQLAGIGRSGIPGGMSEDKYKHLDEAYKTHLQ